MKKGAPAIPVLNVAFYVSDKPREIMLAEALAKGAKVHGDRLEVRRTADYGEDENGDELKWSGPHPEDDVACFFGVKGKSRRIMDDYRAVGKSTLYLDKGYTRSKGRNGHTEYTRISVNGSDPLAYMMSKRPADRWLRLGIDLEERRPGRSGHILLCTSSAKFHEFHKLKDPTRWASEIAHDMATIMDNQRLIVYRPKPSWKAAVPVERTLFTTGATPIKDALKGCHIVVTYGATAAADAIFAGVPALVLGNAVARPVAETKISGLEEPTWATLEKRQRWASCLAYCQWSIDELESGEAWAELKAEILRQRAAKEAA